MVQKEPSLRGRPRNYDPDIALKKATDAFWKAGYSGTSLDDLSKATGMKRPSLYAAFGDKRDLYLKALGRYWENARIGTRDTLSYDCPVRTALLQLYDGAIGQYLSGKNGARGCFAISTATTEAVSDPEIRALLMQGLREIDTAFEDRLRFAKSHGDLPGDADVKTLAMFASATLHTLAIRARAGAARAELDAIAARAVAAICE